MTFRMLKDELIMVDSTRANLDEANALLPQMRAFAIQEALTQKEYYPGEQRCLELMKRLAESHLRMKAFLFQLRRSNDHKVVDVRENNLEDFRTLHKDIGAAMEELMANVLIARLNNAI
jgi:uncharacterized protein YdiU (UPF0061 family)